MQSERALYNILEPRRGERGGGAFLRGSFQGLRGLGFRVLSRGVL